MSKKLTNGFKKNFRIVVSAENNPYLAWQCRLFHYSCISRLNMTPTFMVHEYDDNWHPGFHDIVRTGGSVHAAPSYRITAQGLDYSPRNTPGSLLHAADICSDDEKFIVLCDPDMLFVRPPVFPKAVSGDYCPYYLNYDQPVVRTVAAKMKISDKLLEKRKKELLISVPHVFPKTQAKQVANAWLDAIDLFPPGLWEISMYALGLVIVDLDLRVTYTYLNDHNFTSRLRLKGDMIHYCYGDEVWRKHNFYTSENANNVWSTALKARRNSVLGEILLQMREASDFYKTFQI